MKARHYLALGPYEVPQSPPHWAKNAVQLVEIADGTFVRRVSDERDPGAEERSAEAGTDPVDEREAEQDAAARARE
jgi:hypothetical protein